MCPLLTALPVTLACNQSVYGCGVHMTALTLSRNLANNTQIPLNASQESYTSMQPLTTALATSTTTATARFSRLFYCYTTTQFKQHFGHH